MSLSKVFLSFWPFPRSLVTFTHFYKQFALFSACQFTRWSPVPQTAVSSWLHQQLGSFPVPWSEPARCTAPQAPKTAAQRGRKWAAPWRKVVSGPASVARAVPQHTCAQTYPAVSVTEYQASKALLWHGTAAKPGLRALRKRCLQTGKKVNDTDRDKIVEVESAVA